MVSVVRSAMDFASVASLANSGTMRKTLFVRWHLG